MDLSEGLARLQTAGRSDRRRFLKRLAAGAGVIASGGLNSFAACDRSPLDPGGGGESRALLRLPGSAQAAGLTLVAAPGIADIGHGQAESAWLFNGAIPGPTITARDGENARITLLNNLPEETIVHWHGLIVPEEADGHPRYAVPAGASYDYAFPVRQRAAAYWYHPHAHHRTGAQIHRGLAGFFVVRDEEEDTLALPGGAREVLLMLQDRRLEDGGGFGFAPSGSDNVHGLLGDVPFSNGVRLARLPVARARYRFRILNASQARVYRLGLSTGASLVVIGNDGGLLPTVVEVESVYLAVGERVDVLLDFSPLQAGDRVMLRSLPFQTFAAPGEHFPQGAELDVLEFEVTGGSSDDSPPLPSLLSNVPVLSAADVSGDRTFDFSFAGDGHHATHLINGRSFEMERVDEQIPLGKLERWTFRNLTSFPHPVHLHGSSFQVLSRSGGRNRLYPYEAGWKDTVLLMPTESVDVLVRFDSYTGIFPLHCHNLQHEDLGMMLNIEVV